MFHVEHANGLRDCNLNEATIWMFHVEHSVPRCDYLATEPNRIIRCSVPGIASGDIHSTLANAA